MFLNARGFSDLYTNSGFSLKSPEALPPNIKVNLCFTALNPGIVISLRPMYVFSGIFAEEASVVHV